MKISTKKKWAPCSLQWWAPCSLLERAPRSLLGRAPCSPQAILYGGGLQAPLRRRAPCSLQGGLHTLLYGGGHHHHSSRCLPHRNQGQHGLYLLHLLRQAQLLIARREEGPGGPEGWDKEEKREEITDNYNITTSLIRNLTDESFESVLS